MVAKRRAGGAGAWLAFTCCAAITATPGCGDDAGGSEPAADAGTPAESSGTAGVDLSNVGNAQGGATTAGVTGESALPPPDCVAESQVAQQVPVDMYIMLDRSGSMLADTGAGPTKWDAIREAIESFVQDPESDGLGVGLQYFPLKTPGVPDTCLADDDCGMAGGPCLHRACIPPPNVSMFDVITCLTVADCPRGAIGCQPLGACSGDEMYACFDLGPGQCDTLGDCNGLEALCLFYASCDVDDYMTPAVPIETLPGNAMPIVDSLTAATPAGLTPTSSALIGAINRAATHKMDNPTHSVLAVLATDGLPTDCVPVDIADVADLAAQGTSLANPIPTYVIGVFSSADTDALGNLNQIASAGGTDEAFLVDPDQDVSKQFLDALDRIRGGTLSCEYQLPDPPEGASLDFNRVNVAFTADDETSGLLYVDDQAGCSRAELGWYYDADPAQGGTPSKIVVCPDTCDTITAGTGDRRVDIALGCATLRPD